MHKPRLRTMRPLSGNKGIGFQFTSSRSKLVIWAVHYKSCSPSGFLEQKMRGNPKFDAQSQPQRRCVAVTVDLPVYGIPQVQP